MAIDLGTLQTQNNGKFVVNLEKGFKVNLEKEVLFSRKFDGEVLEANGTLIRRIWKKEKKVCH